jgi:hypothetical protein
MKFYIDESGDYRIPDKLITHKACVTVGVAVSDLIHEQLRKGFESFCRKLMPSEHKNGEPKGAKLTNEHRSEFCELLSGFKGFLIIPSTIDLSLIAFLQKDYKPIQERMYEHLHDLTHTMLHESMCEDLRLLAKQFNNLSLEQCLKIFSLAKCIHESLRSAIIYLSSNGHEASWETILYEIDRTNVRPNSREEIVFTQMIRGWIFSWSKSEPFTLIKEVHTPDHPLVRNFDTPEGTLDGNKLFEDKIIWTDSRKSWGVRLADFASSIVYNAVNDLDDRNGSVTLFASLMRSMPYSLKDGPGLFSPYKIPNDILKLFRGKYRLLGESMKKRTNKLRYETN